MAAIDPSAEPEIDEENKIPRATLKIIRLPLGADDSDDEDDEDYDEDDIEAIKARLAGVISDEDEDMSDDDEDDSEEEKNGGPSDPVKSKKAKQEALAKKLKEELAAEEMDLDNLTNGINGKSKGKAKAIDEDDDEDDSEIDSDDLDEDDEPEEFVLCTLDPTKVRLTHHIASPHFANILEELPAASRHHCWRTRASLLLV
jgi:FK506-binding nuclear protein